MLQIIVPLGGKAARFQERGYTFPKPLIEIGSRSMIEVVLENLAPPKPHQYTFICRKEHLAQFYLGDMLRLLAPGARATGWIAVSALARVYARGGYDWLDAQPTVARIGKTIDLYYLAADAPPPSAAPGP